MYLKKIIASGFKSFAERVSVSLDKQNITGVVGPNGSGKSNIIDAVRWVMGEQNAKMLRGEKATDIIFAGSEKRKALNMAEVSLVFDNSEKSSFCPPEYKHEDEISITRRIYTDGTREYYINRKPVRLKDVTDFFISSSLGSRSYSMIQQGQVDRILQAKPEEIREILEEAAGTLIFKKRQVETQRKLEGINVNLSRIDDILMEVDKQMSTLKEQVERVQEWEGLQKSFQGKEWTVLYYTIQDGKKSLSQLQDKITTILREDAELSVSLSQSEADLYALQLELERADPALKSLQEDITLIREKLASFEASLQAALSLVRNGDGEIAALEQEIEEEASHLGLIEEQFALSEQFLQEAKGQIQELEQSSQDYEERLEHYEEQEMVLTRRLEDNREDIRSLDKILDTNAGKLEIAKRNLQKSAKEKNDRTKKLIEWEQDHSHFLILIEGAQVKVAGLRRSLDKLLEEKNRTIEPSLHQIQEKAREESAELDQLKEFSLEKKAALLSMEELMKKASPARMQLSQLRQDRSFPNPSFLTDSIRFKKNPKTLPAKAIAAFELWAERLVFFSIRELENFCSTLDQHAHQGLKLGRIFASVLSEDKRVRPSTSVRAALSARSAVSLLDWVQVEAINPEEANAEGGLSASKVEDIETLLSKAYYLPGSMETQILEIEKTDPSLWALLRSEGLIFFCEGGQILGSLEDIALGATEKEGSLSFKAERDLCQEELQKAEDKRQRKKEKLEKILSEQEKLKLDLQVIQQKILEQNQTLLEGISELKGLETQLMHKQDAIISVREEFKDLDEAYERLETEVSDLQNSTESLSKERKQTDKALSDLKEDIAQVEEEKDEWKRQLEQKKMELAGYKSKSQTLEQGYAQSQRQKVMLEEKLQKRVNSLAQLREKIANSHIQKEQLEQGLQALFLAREEKQAILSTKEAENASILHEIRTKEEVLKSSREKQQKVKKSISESELELERVKISLRTLRETAVEKYQRDGEDPETAPERPADFDLNKEMREIRSIKNSLENFGPVNMVAAKEYTDLDTRKQFMMENRQEVTSSIDLLLTAIKEIEEHSLKKFMSTFEQLNVEFKALFPVLFPGGEGEITLMDPAQPLSSGVELMVRLPGKKRQSMSLFSGGERALTAIALIFALLKSNPTPFCFLDEVDAPLDEANVGRYNRVLEALSSQFQFIVITHRRKTMEVLDTLYGVTMQEPGVSKVVGVDLNKSLPPHLQKAIKTKVEEKKAEEKSEMSL